MKKMGAQVWNPGTFIDLWRYKTKRPETEIHLEIDGNAFCLKGLERYLMKVFILPFKPNALCATSTAFVGYQLADVGGLVSRYWSHL